MDLNLYPSHQFVQNETVKAETAKSKNIHLKLSNSTIVKGATVGTIYKGTTAIQTFYENSDGSLTFTDIGRNEVRVIIGSVNHEMGIITLTWTKKCDDCHAVVSYEFYMKCTLPIKKFVRPTFEQFLTSEQIYEIITNAGTVTAWDFNCALGDTIMEKYESLYVKCHEVMNVLLRKGAVGYFWICTSAEIASIFETATVGFISSSSYSTEVDKDLDLGVRPFGIPERFYKGAINNRWRLYTDSSLPTNMLLMGCNDKIEDYSHYAKMTIFNFII